MDSTTSAPDVASSPALLFRVGDGDRLYGCDIGDTQEIIPLRPMTRLPGAPSYVRGLINMRGTIVTVLDLGMRLDPSRAPARDGSILLVRHRERLVGLIVDEVADVRPLEVTLDDAPSGIVRGVATSGEMPVVLLDLDAIIKQVLLT